MAKRAYIGVSSKARRVKKIYIGISNKARRVKKVYVGIGGVARPCFSTEITRYGTITGLSAVKSYLAAASNKNYALFGGGYANTKNPGDAIYKSREYATVDAYDRTLTRYPAADLKSRRRLLAAARAGDYVIFAGGLYSIIVNDTLSDESYTQATAEAYGSDLEKVEASPLSEKRTSLAATCVGDYVIFAGGFSPSAGSVYPETDTVDVYDKDLTKLSEISALSDERTYLAAAAVNGIAIFGGGGWAFDLTYAHESDVVDCYDENLTHSVLEALSVPRFSLAAARAGDYIIFAGGAASHSGGGTKYSTVDVYDKNGTKMDTSVSELYKTSYSLAAASVEDYAIFSGGIDDDYNKLKTVNIYDENLTRKTHTSALDMIYKRYDHAAATIGDYVIFAGGHDGDNYLSSAEAYTI